LALRNVSYAPSGSPSPALQPLTNQIILLKSPDILWLARNDIPQ
jgi:hypothetical protein